MNLGEPRPAAAPRHAFVLVVVTLVGLHACMAATRVAASLAVLAQGHPAWVVGALLSALEVRGARLGVATMCVGLGQGIALLLERTE